MTESQVVRFAAVLVILAGYAFVFRAGESRLTEQLGRNEQVSGELRTAQQTLAMRGTLSAERARLRRSLLADGRPGSRAQDVARFMREAAQTAAAHRTAITALAASGSGAPAALAGRPAANAADSLRLDVTIEGRYADVLATTRALSRGSVPANVELASLTRKSAGGSDPAVAAALRVVLERLSAPLAQPGVTHAQPL